MKSYVMGQLTDFKSVGVTTYMYDIQKLKTVLKCKDILTWAFVSLAFGQQNLSTLKADTTT